MTVAHNAQRCKQNTLYRADEHRYGAE